ncbi:MAG: hypothetical protein V1817_04345 [Candidatus Micrarchaeota archaeon]
MKKEIAFLSIGFALIAFLLVGCSQPKVSDAGGQPTIVGTVGVSTETAAPATGKVQVSSFTTQEGCQNLITNQDIGAAGFDVNLLAAAFYGHTYGETGCSGGFMLQETINGKSTAVITDVRLDIAFNSDIATANEGEFKDKKEKMTVGYKFNVGESYNYETIYREDVEDNGLVYAQKLCVSGSPNCKIFVNFMLITKAKHTILVSTNADDSYPDFVSKYKPKVIALGRILLEKIE